MTPKDKELVELIARCALQDEHALKALYDRLAPYLNGVAFRILQSNEASSEAVQEGFIQIWDNASTYHSSLSKPLTWLTSIVRYRALDCLDQEKRHRDNNAVDIDPHEAVSQMEDTQDELKKPEANARYCQLSQHISVCLDTLGRNTKCSIELAYLYGFSREEIANKLSTNVNTVKSWLRRGGERLKCCLASNFEVSL